MSARAAARRTGGRLHPDAVAHMRQQLAPTPHWQLPKDKDGHARRGRVFTLRLSSEAEVALKALQAEHEKQLSWSAWNPYGPDTKTGSLGAFIVWAARQFKPAAKK